MRLNWMFNRCLIPKDSIFYVKSLFQGLFTRKAWPFWRETFISQAIFFYHVILKIFIWTIWNKYIFVFFICSLLLYFRDYRRKRLDRSYDDYSGRFGRNSSTDWRSDHLLTRICTEGKSVEISGGLPRKYQGCYSPPKNIPIRFLIDFWEINDINLPPLI